MPELDLSEVAAIKNQLLSMNDVYLGLSDCILEKLVRLKNNHPKTIRVVFSRQPKIKDINGILRKVAELRSAGKKKVDIRDVKDVIALTILCPYETDVPQIYEWVKGAFDVSPEMEQARRRNEDGHRGYHFLLQMSRSEARTFPAYRGLTCELQIKTILQEAFDAKSHDLAYKNADISEELTLQFLHLSTLLMAIDGQSEFLKDLILRGKREVELRRRACLQVYLKDCGDIPAKLGMDPTKLPDLPTTIEILDDQNLVPTKDLCRFTAYCAITFDNDYLKRLTIDLIERYVDLNPQDPRRFVGRGALFWMLNMHESALNDMQAIIGDTEGKTGEEELKSNREAKNNFVYYTCDWYIFGPGVPEERLKQAAEYVASISPAQMAEELDTIGLHKVVFSSSVAEIDEGRRLLAESLALRTRDRDIYEKFYELHQFIAVNRMLKLMSRPAP